MSQHTHSHTGNFTIENSGNYAIAISLESAVYLVEKKSKLLIFVDNGEIKISASCFGTAYAYGIPESWQKDSGFYRILIESNKQYVCECQVDTKPLFFGLFHHIKEIKLCFKTCLLQSIMFPLANTIIYLSVYLKNNEM